MIPTLEQLQKEFGELTAAPGVPSSARLAPPADSAEPAAACPPNSCQATDPKAKGYHLDVSLTAEQIVPAARLLDRHGFAIDAVTGVDWIAAHQMEVVYDFFHLEAPWQVVLRTRVSRDHPEVPTISDIYPGANWHERETHEFFGIRFAGHPNLAPLLLPEDATYHPLRKDFVSAP